jgi:hypothetical protein
MDGWGRGVSRAIRPRDGGWSEGGRGLERGGTRAGAGGGKGLSFEQIAPGTGARAWGDEGWSESGAKRCRQPVTVCPERVCLLLRLCYNVRGIARAMGIALLPGPMRRPGRWARHRSPPGALTMAGVSIEPDKVLGGATHE